MCQQLNRSGTGIEVNPGYVKMSQERLQNEFSGFDSVDPRMKRVPFDLRKKSVRQEYLENHKRWFLSNHENALRDFEKSVETLYPERPRELEQMKLLESNAKYTARRDASARSAARRS